MRNYTDITDQCTPTTYSLENHPSPTNPEDLLLAAEEAALAGEDFEGYGVAAFDFGYRTPCSDEEHIEAMCRREVIAEERREVNEASWLWKVRRRKVLIKRRLPNKLAYYQKTIKK